MKIYVDIESVREVLADVKDCEDKQYALALLEWAVDKRTISEEAIRADERAKVLEILKNEMPHDICDGNEAIEEIERILNSNKLTI